MIFKNVIFVLCLTYVNAADFEMLKHTFKKYGVLAPPLANVIGFMMDGTSEKMAEMCKSGEETRTGCKICTCSDNNFKMNCRELEDCDEDNLQADKNDAARRVAEKHKDQEREKDKKEDDQNCPPGLFFHNFCNTCLCSMDGMDMVCTLKSCPPGVFNPDGSLVKNHLSKAISHVVDAVQKGV